MLSILYYFLWLVILIQMGGVTGGAGVGKTLLLLGVHGGYGVLSNVTGYEGVLGFQLRLAIIFFPFSILYIFMTSNMEGESSVVASSFYFQILSKVPKPRTAHSRGIISSFLAVDLLLP
jgi:hypothetical protein